LRVEIRRACVSHAGARRWEERGSRANAGHFTAPAVIPWISFSEKNA
jgi:hypothetical protein